MPVSLPTLLAIDRVERSRAKNDQVRLRLTGHWLGADAGPASEALLVVQLHGSRHRFPASRDERDPLAEPAGLAFTASFTIPDWAVPEQVGQAVLWVGETVVAVPPPGTTAPAEPVAVAPVSTPVPVSPVVTETAAPEEPERGRVDAGAQPVTVDAAGNAEVNAAGRSGPLADLLYKETVAALHAELEARSAEAARLRAELAQTRSELEGRAGAQARLQEAHAELREELTQLMTAVAGQRGEVDRRLAAVEAERDGAREQLEAARAQSTQAGEELGAARAEAEAARTELQAARAELEAARAEAETARSQLESELSASRAESEAMLAAARAESEAMLSAARSDSDSRVHEAERRAAQLAERLQTLTVADRRHADEGSALREQLAAAHVSRDAAHGEAAGLRAELERLGSELSVVREQGTAPGGDLDEARQLLADARALTASLSRSAG